MENILNAYRKYGEQLTSYDLLKLVALLLMTADHVGYYLYPDELWWRVAGRLSAPVWFFLAGYSTSRRTMPMILAVGLAVSLVNLWFGQGPLPLNILFSIVIARLAVEYIQRRGLERTRMAETAALLILGILPSIYVFEYGTMGILTAWMGSLVRKGWRTQSHAGLAVAAWFSYALFQIISLPYDAAQIGVIVAGAALIYRWLWVFEMEPLPVNGAAPYAAITKFLARYSLYYYALHKLALQIVSSLKS